MTSAYNQFLKVSCKQHIPLKGRISDIWVYGDN